MPCSRITCRADSDQTFILAIVYGDVLEVLAMLRPYSRLAKPGRGSASPCERSACGVLRPPHEKQVPNHNKDIQRTPCDIGRFKISRRCPLGLRGSKEHAERAKGSETWGIEQDSGLCTPNNIVAFITHQGEAMEPHIATQAFIKLRSMVEKATLPA